MTTMKLIIIYVTILRVYSNPIDFRDEKTVSSAKNQTYFANSKEKTLYYDYDENGNKTNNDIIADVTTTEKHELLKPAESKIGSILLHRIRRAYRFHRYDDPDYGYYDRDYSDYHRKNSDVGYLESRDDFPTVVW